MKITKSHARRFLLAHQMISPPAPDAKKTAIVDFVKRVGCIQFDPLDMVGCMPHLVLQSRVPGYRPEQLLELLYEDRALVDGWDKNMSIYCTGDWPCFERHRAAARIRYEDRVSEVLPVVRQALTDRGQLSSSGLDLGHFVDWPWAPTRAGRAALESMYFWGELVIHSKTRTRKTYDLAMRHLPSHLLNAPDPNPSDEDYFRWHVLRRIGSVGMLWKRPGDAWLGIRNMKSPERTSTFRALEHRGEIIPVDVEGISHTLYVRREDARLLEETAGAGCQTQPRATFLAPLDNMLWDRILVAQLFDFNYTWEVYKPAAERQYGYYVLPVLYGDRLVARVEPRFDRRTSHLRIINWWWEPAMDLTADLKRALRICVDDFARYLSASGIEFQTDGATGDQVRWLKSACSD